MTDGGEVRYDVRWRLGDDKVRDKTFRRRSAAMNVVRSLQRDVAPFVVNPAVLETAEFARRNAADRPDGDVSAP